MSCGALLSRFMFTWSVTKNKFVHDSNNPELMSYVTAMAYRKSVFEIKSMIQDESMISMISRITRMCSFIYVLLIPFKV